ncbi:protein of unknown function [Streptantibioticus cattleyicolor NRRL 8057 = DSM 46488]|nr:protein of unknown function [Streptantibioticus cattleyicolor NRRL 8057 = DSM 46488]
MPCNVPNPRLRRAAAAAMRKYSRMADPHAATRAVELQAADLITDVLLMFGPEAADLVLKTAVAAWEREQAYTEPVYELAVQ